MQLNLPASFRARFPFRSTGPVRHTYLCTAVPFRMLLLIASSKFLEHLYLQIGITEYVRPTLTILLSSPYSRLHISPMCTWLLLSQSGTQ